MYIGVDLGATNIKVGLVSHSGCVKDKVSVLTEIEKGSDQLIDKIVYLIDALIKKNATDKNQLEYIGVGVPGSVDSNGLVLECVNLDWKNYNLKEKLEKATLLEVYIANDATLACLAEFAFGTLKSSMNSALITIGTGIGSSFVIKGKIYISENGTSSEIGHMVVGDNYYDCNCGRNGCLETYSSASAVLKEAIRIINDADENSIKSNLLDDYKNQAQKLTCKDVFDYAKYGDENAKNIINRMVKYLVRAIINLSLTMDLEIVSIAGGVSKAGQFLIDLIIEEIERERIFRDSIKAPEIILASLNLDSGIVGAAMIKRFI